MSTARNKEFITGKEHDLYIDDLSGVMNHCLTEIIKLADRHNIDRDNAIQHFISTFSAMSQLATFANYAVDNSDCTGCKWRKEKRYQRCSCCRRNKSLKDGYEKEATQ